MTVNPTWNLIKQQLAHDVRLFSNVRISVGCSAAQTTMGHSLVTLASNLFEQCEIANLICELCVLSLQHTCFPLCPEARYDPS